MSLLLPTGTFLYVYMYVWTGGAGAHRTYAHARKLRETPTQHLYTLPSATRARGARGRAVETAESGTWGDTSRLALR